MKNYIGSQQHFEDEINAHYDKKEEMDAYYRQQEKRSIQDMRNDFLSNYKVKREKK